MRIVRWILHSIFWISSAIQHGQLFLQGLGLVGFGIGGGSLLAVVLAVGAAFDQQPWYWIASLSVSAFAAVVWGAVGVKQLAVPVSPVLTVPRPAPREPSGVKWYCPELEHDTVLWKDIGDSFLQAGIHKARVEGPFCPIDHTSLCYGLREPYTSDTISDVGDGPLRCPQCQAVFLLDKHGSRKQVGTSEGEVEAIFNGMRRSTPEKYS